MTIGGVILWILGKVAGKAFEKGGEKAYDAVQEKIHKLLGKKRLDFLSSDLDFRNARDIMEGIQKRYKAIFVKLDELYAWGGDIKKDRLTIVGAKLDEIIREHERIGLDFKHLAKRYPSLVLIIGKFMLDFQDTIELLAAAREDSELDRELMFVTYVPRVFNARGSRLWATKEEIDANLADFTQAAARNQIPTETLVRLRQYERLSWVLGTAIGHAIDFMDRAKEGGNIPELIEAMSNSVQALRLVTERLRIAEGNATKDEVVDEANAHQLKATRILGSGGSGPIGDRIAKANLEATKAIRLLDREK